MSDQQPHTPTTEEVRQTYIESIAFPKDPDAVEGRLGDEFDRWYSAEIAAAEQRGAARIEQAIYELTEAIRLTVEYVGNDTLPPINGWSWFEALRKYHPELAEHFEQNPQLKPDNQITRDIIAEQRHNRADRLEGDDETH